MSSLIRHAIIGAKALSVAAAGGLAYWVHAKTKGLPDHQKGSLLPRMKEIVHSFQQQKTIQDAYTAKHHIDLVASLPSKSFILAKALPPQKAASPVFPYHGHAPGNQEFVFAGFLPDIPDAQARDEIIKGNYIRCPSELEVMDLYPGKYKEVDVIIPGTIDPKKCQKFKNDLLRYLAVDAATNPHSLNPERPYLDTPVFTCSEQALHQIGDLTDMPPSVNNEIIKGNFVACNFFASQKTRLSHGNYKKVGAIVTGTTNENICKTLHFQHMKQAMENFKQ